MDLWSNAVRDTLDRKQALWYLPHRKVRHDTKKFELANFSIYFLVFVVQTPLKFSMLKGEKTITSHRGSNVERRKLEDPFPGVGLPSEQLASIPDQAFYRNSGKASWREEVSKASTFIC